MLRIDDMQRQAVDFFRTGDISLKNALHYGTIQLDKLEYVEQTETAAPCVGGCTISAN